MTAIRVFHLPEQSRQMHYDSIVLRGCCSLTLVAFICQFGFQSRWFLRLRTSLLHTSVFLAIRNEFAGGMVSGISVCMIEEGAAEGGMDVGIRNGVKLKRRLVFRSDVMMQGCSARLENPGERGD